MGNGTAAMRRVGMATLVILAAPLAWPAAGATPDAAGDEQGSWLVALREPRSTPDSPAHLAAMHDGRVGHVFTSVFDGFEFVGTAADAARLSRHASVRRIVEDGRVSAAADVPSTGFLRVDAAGAHALGATGTGATIAVLDTGVDLAHPELAPRLHPSLSKNCVTPGEPPADDNSHGTHVAGIAVAARNGKGPIGVAPDASLVPVKVLDRDARGTFADLLCGIDYVAAHSGEIDVANLSLNGVQTSGDSCNDGALRQAVCELVGRGVAVVAAAGNGGNDASSIIPARYPEVIAVSALDDRDGTPADDAFALASNWGAPVDVIAPGVLIRSTVPGGTRLSSGTSAAAAHVSAVVAMARRVNPALSPAGARALLLRSGECPDGTAAGADTACAGQGTWLGDHDPVAEPLLDASLAAASAVGPVCEGFVATIAGGAAADALAGTAGPDVIVGLGGDDVIDGMAGDDVVCGDEGDDQLAGGLGRDVLAGGADDDGLVGGAAADDLRGGDGDDRLLGSRGNDVIRGDAGVDIIDGEDGNDTASFLTAPAGVEVALGLGTATGDGDDHLVDVENLIGSMHDDLLVGDESANLLQSRGGHDRVEGRGGDDDVRGNGGNDRVLGGDGNDIVRGGSGIDDLLGGAGDDVVEGGSGGPDACDGGDATASGDDGTDVDGGGCEALRSIP